MKTQEGSGIVAPSFFISALDGGEWLVSLPSALSPRPRERAPGNHCIGGSVGPRIGLKAGE
jgi:hypothetical protein